jgi:hypothetical protein
VIISLSIDKEPLHIDTAPVPSQKGENSFARSNQPPGRFTQYRSSQHTRKSNSKPRTDSIRMRIRGKSNHIEVKDGSLRKTMYEQHKGSSSKKKRKVENYRLKQLEQIERYREERLLNEIRMMEEEKILMYHQQKNDMNKEKKRYRIGIIFI